MSRNSSDGSEGAKFFLVVASLIFGLIVFGFVSSDGFSAREGEGHASIASVLAGFCAVFIYPIVGAVLYPLTRGLKSMAHGAESLSSHKGDRISAITFWPIVTLFALVVYPCLILINLLVD